MMADNEQQTEEQLSNDILKEVFQELHNMVVDNINTFSVIGELFAAKVISTNDMQELHFINNPLEKCTRLLIILHKAQNPRSFVELREAIKKEQSYEWLVAKIDEKYYIMTSASAPSPVARVCSNPSLKPLDDITGLQRVIDGFRKDDATLTTDNRSLLEANAKLKADNEKLSRDNASLMTENSRLVKENDRLKDDLIRLCLNQSESWTEKEKMVKIVNELDKDMNRVQILHNYTATPEVNKVDAATGEPELKCNESSVAPGQLFKEAVPQRLCPADDPNETSRDADVLLNQRLRDIPQLLFALDQPPTDSEGSPRQVLGLAMLDNCLHVVYEDYDTVEVFDCEDHGRKIKDIQIKEMKLPADMVGSSVTSQLFLSEWRSDVIWRVGLQTEVSDVFVETGYEDTRLSLVVNRLLVTSQFSLSMFDIISGERLKMISFKGDIERYFVGHAIESNRDSCFVSHGPEDNRTVSEVDSDGRVVRVLDNEQQFTCGHLALDSVGRLLVADWKNSRVVLLDGNLKFERILIDNERLDNERPWRLSYKENNNRLTVGLRNGQVKIFKC